MSAVAFSPDGRRLVSGSSDDTLRLWDAETGAPLLVLEGPASGEKARKWVTDVAFSPDGRRLASGSWDKTVHLWDAQTGAPLQVLEGHTAMVFAVAFSPDGRRIASGSTDHTVRLWDAETGAPLQVLEGHTSQVDGVAFSPDGGRIVSASTDGTVRTWDTETGAPLLLLEGHAGPVGSAVFSPDGRRIASVAGRNDGTMRTGRGDRTLRIWDAETGANLLVLEGPHNAVAFSPDGRCIAAAFDDNVGIWETDLQQALAVWRGQAERRPIQRTLDRLFKQHVLLKDVLQALEEDPGGLSREQAATARELARLRGDPSPESLNATAWAIVDPDGTGQGGRALALKLARAAVAAAPEDPAIRDTLAWALFANGLPDEALAESDGALELVRDASGDVKASEGSRDRLLALIEAARKTAGRADAQQDGGP